MLKIHWEYTSWNWHKAQKAVYAMWGNFCGKKHHIPHLILILHITQMHKSREHTHVNRIYSYSIFNVALCQTNSLAYKALNSLHTNTRTHTLTHTAAATSLFCRAWVIYILRDAERGRRRLQIDTTHLDLFIKQNKTNRNEPREREIIYAYSRICFAILYIIYSIVCVFVYSYVWAVLSRW